MGNRPHLQCACCAVDGGGIPEFRGREWPRQRARQLQQRKPRPTAYRAVIQTKQQRRESDALQGCHWTVSLLKRWLLGTHAGAMKPKHLQAYLDEFAFRFNRRNTNGVGRIAARTIEQLVARPPLTMKMLILETVPCRAFRS